MELNRNMILGLVEHGPRVLEDKPFFYFCSQSDIYIHWSFLFNFKDNICVSVAFQVALRHFV